MSIKRQIVNRTKIVYLLFVALLALVLIGQLLRIQLIDSKKYKAMAVENESRKMVVPADRGNILAKDGRLLSCSIPYFKLRFDCLVVHDTLFDKNIKPLSKCLAKYFKDKSSSEYYKMLYHGRHGKRPNRYLLINRRELKYEDLIAIKKFPLFNLSKNKGGLIVEKIQKRIQPHINLGSRTIGDLNQSKLAGLEGSCGLESAFERELKGVAGKGIKKKMIGSWLPFVTEEPVDGKDIVTTLDINFQDIAESELEKQLIKYDAESGSVVLMEVKTGAVRAIANLGRSESGAYFEDKNYAVGEAIEYGSVFKLASMIAVLEDGYVDALDSISTGNGRYKYYDRTMVDSHRKGFGRITVEDAFIKSSNVGISKIINDHYRKRPSDFVQRLYSMRLNQPLGLSIQGEGRPLIKYPTDKDWYGTTLPWMSIGYEVHLTALQILSLYNTVANDGVMVKPMFVEEIRDRSGAVQKMEREILLSKLCSDKTIAIVRSMLEGVVERGTARNIRTSKYKIAGKTGTALISDGGSGYSVKKYVGSFVGYFPADNPVYSCIVTIKNPDKKKGFYGNITAAPVFRALADKVYAQTYYLHPQKTLKAGKPRVANFARAKKDDVNTIASELNLDFSNIYSKYDWVDVRISKGKYKFAERKMSKRKVPNVKGMCLRDAVYVLENAGLRVRYSGIGNVYAQTMTPGRSFRPAQVVTIRLK
ncbi:MAG: penicillin-binding protein [Marinifilaceae bacterium]